MRRLIRHYFAAEFSQDYWRQQSDLSRDATILQAQADSAASSVLVVAVA
jgi:hypothetical protein